MSRPWKIINGTLQIFFFFLSFLFAHLVWIRLWIWQKAKNINLPKGSLIEKEFTNSIKVNRRSHGPFNFKYPKYSNKLLRVIFSSSFFGFLHRFSHLSVLYIYKYIFNENEWENVISSEDFSLELHDEDTEERWYGVGGIGDKTAILNNLKKKKFHIIRYNFARVLFWIKWFDIVFITVNTRAIYKMPIHHMQTQTHLQHYSIHYMCIIFHMFAINIRTNNPDSIFFCFCWIINTSMSIFFSLSFVRCWSPPLNRIEEKKKKLSARRECIKSMEAFFFLYTFLLLLFIIFTISFAFFSWLNENNTNTQFTEWMEKYSLLFFLFNFDG